MKWPTILLILFVSRVNANAQAADTLYNVQLKEARVTARWKNDTDRYHYNQMKYYVTTILPYLNAATQLFSEIEVKAGDPAMSRKDFRKYVSSREDDMRTVFEDRVRDLNKTQGALLVKLIARQTNTNLYDILSEFRNTITAIKWQAWARINGMNLNKTYDPDTERDLENIMDELGYPLPQSYICCKSN